jgi:hypothetical protein
MTHWDSAGRQVVYIRLFSWAPLLQIMPWGNDCPVDTQKWLTQIKKESFASSTSQLHDCEEKISLDHLIVIHYTKSHQKSTIQKDAEK